jgi:hypothetical protein
MQQWTYLTSPIAVWKIHTRKGELTPLPVKTAESTIEDEYAFTLNADQVDALVHASEADALLAHLGLDLNIVGNESHHYWVLSQTCLQTWEKSGSKNRDVLNAFAKRIFDSKGKALQEKPWQTFLAKATLNDFGR